MKRSTLLLLIVAMMTVFACKKDLSDPFEPSTALSEETEERVYRTPLEEAFFSLDGLGEEQITGRSQDPILQDANNALYQINLAEDIVTQYNEQIGMPDWSQAISDQDEALWVPVYKDNNVNGIFAFTRGDSSLYFRPLLRPLYARLNTAFPDDDGLIGLANYLFDIFDNDGNVSSSNPVIEDRSCGSGSCYLLTVTDEETGIILQEDCLCSGTSSPIECCGGGSGAGPGSGPAEPDGGEAEAGGGSNYNPDDPYSNPNWWNSWWADILGGGNPANTTTNTDQTGSGGSSSNLSLVEKGRLLGRLMNEQHVLNWLIERLNLPIGEHGGSLYHIILGSNPHIAGPLFLFLNGFYDGVPPDPNVAMDLLDLIADFGIVGGQYAPPLDLSQAEIEHILSFDHSLIDDIRAILEANPNNEKAIQAVHDLMALQMCTMALSGCQVTDYDNDLPLLLSFYEGLTDEAYDWIHSPEIENSGIKHELIQFLINGPMQPVSDRAQHVNAVVEFLAERQNTVQFEPEEMIRLIETPELFQEISSFLSQHLFEGASESNKNLASAIARAYDDIYAEFGSTTLDLGDGPLDPIRDIVIDMLLETVKELVADLIPGGTLATIGPELFNNLQGGQWMDAMYNAVDIVLNEADTFFPAAKVTKLALGAYTTGKALKKAFEAFKEAKKLGEDYLLGLYNVFTEKLGWDAGDIRDRFKWQSDEYGAKLLDVNPDDFKQEILDQFGEVIMPFPDWNGNPVYKIIDIDPAPNASVYLVYYTGSSSGADHTFEFVVGPKNANSWNDIKDGNKFKIRI